MDDLILRLGQKHGALCALAIRHEAALGLGARRSECFLENIDDTLAQITARLEARQARTQCRSVHQLPRLPGWHHCDGRFLAIKARNS